MKKYLDGKGDLPPTLKAYVDQAIVTIKTADKR